MKKIIAVLMMVLACATSAFAFTFGEFMGDKVAYLESGECVKFNSYYISNETDMRVMYPYERNYFSFYVEVPDSDTVYPYSNVKREGNKVLLGVNKSRYRGEMIYAGNENPFTDDRGKFFGVTWLGDCSEFENDRYIIRSFGKDYFQVFDKASAELREVEAMLKKRMAEREARMKERKPANTTSGFSVSIKVPSVKVK